MEGSIGDSEGRSATPVVLQAPLDTTNAIGSTSSAQNPSSPAEVKSEPFWRKILRKLGFSPMVVMFMVKGALTPTICMAIYQRHSVAADYLNLGYLMIIISLLTVPMLPRGKFLMNLFVSVFFTCFGAAMVLFGHWCGNQARKHTTPAGATAQIANGYNSSASTVNAIFMVLNMFGISTLRAARPALAIPAVSYTIYVVVGFSYGPQEATNDRSLRFTRELFYAFLTGQAIAAGVSLFVIPVSSRKVFFAEATGFLQSSRGLLKTQLAFVEALQISQMCDPAVPNIDKEGEDAPSPVPAINDPESSAALRGYDEKKVALRAGSTALLSLGAKLREDVTFAKRETAYGYLRSADIYDLYLLLRNIMMPISGLSTITDISERLRSRYQSDRRIFEEAQCPEARNFDIPDEYQTREQAEWQELLQTVHSSFEPLTQILDEGVLHVLILLELIPGSKKGKRIPSQETPSSTDDVEKGAQPPSPGDLSFGDYLEREIQVARKQRSESLEAWAREKGLSSIFHTSSKHVRWPSDDDHDGYRSLRSIQEARAVQRLQLILYMEYLLYSVAIATLALVRFAESKVKDGTMKQQRIIFPAIRTIRKWIRGIITGGDTSPGVDSMDGLAGNVETIHLGDSLKVPKDPEHLPPKNFGQVVGNKLRLIPRLLGSSAVHFGVRVTIAAMSIAIMAYLKDTHAFYIRERVVWGVVMIAIGMNPTSGSAVFTLLGNLGATIIGMVCSFINWYIVDQKTAGIIVFFFLFQMLYFYFAAKYPRFLVAIVAGAITHVLIIGYELQVRVIGEKIATATGQAFYPIYELAPYRLLAVAGGVVVAYIWTIFPVPITEGSVLRRDLGNSLFLLANYLSAVTATVDRRVQNQEGDMTISMSPGRQLEKMRLKVLQKQLSLLASMRQNLAFMAWEPSFGGDFPKQIYQAILNEVENVVNYLTIINFASEAFVNARSETSSSVWLSRFALSRSESDRRSHKVTTLLALLSASLKNKQPLPPYLKAPTHSHLPDHMRGTDSGVLDLSNINEPGFRAFAVIEVANLCLVDSVASIVRHVRELVGEVDFTYQVRTSSAGTSNTELDHMAGGRQKIQ